MRTDFHEIKNAQLLWHHSLNSIKMKYENSLPKLSLIVNFKTTWVVALTCILIEII